jgi:hypothetical protein
MMRFRCPECGRELEVAAKYGDEIVSVYCLAHKAGVDTHTQPVYMTLVRAAVVTVIYQEPIAA